MNTEFIKHICVKIWHGLSRALAKCVYFNDGFSMPQIQKWTWYFKYREALIILNNPKSYTHLEFIPYTPDSYTIEQITERNRINKQKALKAKITKKENKLNDLKNEFDLYCKNYNMIFPITSDPQYKTMKASIEVAEDYIKNLKFSIK